MSRVLGWLGLLGHLAFVVVFAASGLLVPGWAVGVLLGAWLALLVSAVRLWRWQPAALLALPVVDAVLWFVLISAGESLLGWTA